MSRRVSARHLKAELSSAPCTHFSAQPKRLAAEHRVRFENSRSAQKLDLRPKVKRRGAAQGF
jgi:hypothetical protein